MEKNYEIFLKKNLKKNKKTKIKKKSTHDQIDQITLSSIFELHTQNVKQKMLSESKIKT